MIINFLDAVAVLAALYFGRDALNTFVANRRDRYRSFAYDDKTLVVLALVCAWLWARGQA